MTEERKTYFLSAVFVGLLCIYAKPLIWPLLITLGKQLFQIICHLYIAKSSGHFFPSVALDTLDCPLLASFFQTPLSQVSLPHGLWWFLGSLL